MFHKTPLLVAMRRIQFRPARLIPLLVVMFISIPVIFIICWFMVDIDPLKNTKVFMETLGRYSAYLILSIQYISLAVIGTHAIETRITEDRISGIFSFHRLTTLTSDAIILGYILGTASDVYLLWFIAVVAGFLSVALGGITMWQYLGATGMILVSAWFFHILASLAGLNSLIQPEKRFARGGSSTILPLILLIPFGDLWMFTPLPTILRLLLSKEEISGIYLLSGVNFFNINLPVTVYSLLILVVFGTIFYLAARRKVHAVVEPLFSKLVVLTLMFIIGIILIGRYFNIICLNQTAAIPFSRTAVISFVQILLSFSPVILVGLIVPRRLLLRHNLVRIMEGRFKVRWWDEDASSLVAGFILALLSVMMQIIVYLFARDSEMAVNWINVSLRCMILIFLVVFVSGITEGSRMRLPRNADQTSSVICGIWWFLSPVIFYAYTIKVSEPQLYMLGFSPLAALVVGCIHFDYGFEPQIRVVLIIAFLITVLAAGGAQLFRRHAKRLFQSSLVY